MQVILRSCMLSCFSNVTLCDAGLLPTRLLCLWGSPGKNTGVGCHFLLQGICQTQGSNPDLVRLSCIDRRVLYHQHHLGSLQVILPTSDSFSSLLSPYTHTHTHTHTHTLTRANTFLIPSVCKKSRCSNLIKVLNEIKSLYKIC